MGKLVVARELEAESAGGGRPPHLNFRLSSATAGSYPQLGERDTSKNSAFISTDLSLDRFPEHKWLIRRIDRLRRSFLWRGG
jgi:hypothetical protein